jgi:formamidopyrimidine-DNA glycosylase
MPKKLFFMPELPEVQTVVNDLQAIVGDTITDFSSAWSKALKNENSKPVSELEFRSLVLNKKIIAIQRHGKNIIIQLSGKMSLIAHLRMTGQLLLSQNFQFPIFNIQNLKKQEGGKHFHHFFLLKKNNSLIFADIRKFGTLQILPTEKLPLIFAKLGIDPFAKNFSQKTFDALFNRRYSKSIKEFLMDQEIILGIGNIYASEILYDCRVNPAHKITSITNIEKRAIYRSIIKILTLAIKLRGTSVSDYRDASGRKGGFQNELKVYKKLDQPCQKCATMIARTVLGQRSTFFCPKCQK